MLILNNIKIHGKLVRLINDSKLEYPLFTSKQLILLILCQHY